MKKFYSMGCKTLNQLTIINELLPIKTTIWELPESANSDLIILNEYHID